MDGKTYADLVVKEVHKRAFSGKLECSIRDRAMTAKLGGPVELTMMFKDKEVDSAEWEFVSIQNPVGIGSTTMGNSAKDKNLSRDISLSPELQKLLDEIFELLVLQPRRKQAAAILKQIIGN